MNDATLRLLSRVFGQKHALSAYLILRRLAVIAAVGAVILALVAFLVWDNLRQEQFEHIAYHPATVTATAPLNNDASTGLIVDVTLPDGQQMRLVATEANITSQITETACVEQRRSGSTGEDQYRLRSAFRCGA